MITTQNTLVRVLPLRFLQSYSGSIGFFFFRDLSLHKLGTQPIGLCSELVSTRTGESQFVPQSFDFGSFPIQCYAGLCPVSFCSLASVLSRYSQLIAKPIHFCSLTI